MQSAYVIFIALLLGGASTSSGRMLPGASDLFGLPTIVESPKTVGEAYDMQVYVFSFAWCSCRKCQT